MPGDYDFPSINSFRKKVGLPSLKKWRVSADDTMVTGRVLTMIKHKGFLTNGSSPVKMRETTVTKQGYMIIYFSDEKGYVVDIPDAMKVTTCTTTLRAKDIGGAITTLKRTQIEIKLRYGTVMLSALGKDAIPWIEAINRLACPANKDNRDRLSSCTLESIPFGNNRDSLNLEYSVISDNSISIASPKFELRKETKPAEPDATSVTPTPNGGQLSVTPTPKRRSIVSPLVQKKNKKKLFKQSLMVVAAVQKKSDKGGEEKKEVKEEAKPGDETEDEDKQRKVAVVEENGKEEEKRKHSASPEATDELTPRA